MNEPSCYKSVAAYQTAEIIEKKSRFIAEVFPVHTEEEAQAQIVSVEKKYHDARHHCHAYVLGMRGDYLRFSDNGEPQGTAGKPILTVITSAQITDTLIVVTRYFGGILLGTGGLGRAYSQSAQAALEKADIVTHTLGRDLTFRIGYALTGAVDHYLKERGTGIASPVYTDDVRYRIFVPEADVRKVVNDLTNICSGNIDITESEPYFS